MFMRRKFLYIFICQLPHGMRVTGQLTVTFQQFALDWLYALQWRHNGRDYVSNHQPHDCLLNRLFRRRSNTTSKLRVTGLCAGNSPGPVNSPYRWPVTRKMFPSDDVIMDMPVVTCRQLGIWWRMTILLSCKATKLQDRRLNLYNCSDIWQASVRHGSRIGPPYIKLI